MNSIQGEEKLTQIFGKWPSFHDSEIWSLLCERTTSGVIVTIVLHVFEITQHIDGDGRFRLQNHTRVTLRFTKCEEIHLDDFKRQNVLFALKIRESKSGHHVAFESSAGLDGTLECQQLEVVDALPWISPDDYHYTSRA